MVNQASIQSRINKGYGKVALKLGAAYQFFRPALPGAGEGSWDENTWDAGAVWNEGLVVPTPIGGYVMNGPTWEDGGTWDAENWEGPDQRTVSLMVSLNAEDWKYVKPDKHGKPYWYAAFDGTDVLSGDYLVGPQGIFFVASKSPILTTMVVECNRTINVLRPQIQTGVGVGNYGGNTAATETPMLAAWPASVLQGGVRAEVTEAQLPGDKRQPGWTVLLPYYTGVTIRTGDVITDDLQRRMIVGSAELTSLGWRLTALQVVT